MPLHGFTRMFENMLSHENIKIMLNTDYHEIMDFIPFKKMIFTGPVDEYYDFRFGKLPYRSLQFAFETHNVKQYQSAPVINYPNDYAYTRVTEFKYLTGQESDLTTLVYEFPQDEGDPYYPVPRPENAELYKKYATLAEETPNVYFAGRLATYKYYNMDQVVAQALTLFNKVAAHEHEIVVPAGTMSRSLVDRDGKSFSFASTGPASGAGSRVSNGNGHGHSGEPRGNGSVSRRASTKDS
jgi:UDP-galactopyranose mutase